jgi:hypothetical protein
MQKGSYIIFGRNFVGDCFRRRQIFGDFNTGFWKSSKTPTFVSISKWGFEENILRKNISSTDFAMRDALPAKITNWGWLKFFLFCTELPL